MLNDAKSLLIFTHGESLPILIANTRNLLAEMENGKVWEDNCISPNDNFEWDSSKDEHSTLAAFLDLDTENREINSLRKELADVERDRIFLAEHAAKREMNDPRNCWMDITNPVFTCKYWLERAREATKGGDGS